MSIAQHKHRYLTVTNTRAAANAPTRDVETRPPRPTRLPSGSLALEVDPPVYSHEPTMVETPPRPVTALEEVADAEGLLVLAPLYFLCNEPRSILWVH